MFWLEIWFLVGSKCLFENGQVEGSAIFSSIIPPPKHTHRKALEHTFLFNLVPHSKPWWLEPCGSHTQHHSVDTPVTKVSVINPPILPIRALWVPHMPWPPLYWPALNQGQRQHFQHVLLPPCCMALFPLVTVNPAQIIWKWRNHILPCTVKSIYATHTEITCFLQLWWLQQSKSNARHFYNIKRQTSFEQSAYFFGSACMVRKNLPHAAREEQKLLFRKLLAIRTLESLDKWFFCSTFPPDCFENSRICQSTCNKYSCWFWQHVPVQGNNQVVTPVSHIG